MFYKSISYFIEINFFDPIFCQHIIKEFDRSSIKKSRRFMIKRGKSKFQFCLILYLGKFICDRYINDDSPHKSQECNRNFCNK